MKKPQLALAFSALHLFQPALSWNSTWNSTCRCIHTDPCWPSEDLWQQLNETVNGNLIKTLPVGHVCHDPTYDAALCDIVKANWEDPNWRTSIPESILSPSFANNSCDPFSPRNGTCEVGGYVPYSINVTNPNDISAGLKFARDRNIRVVIKNTGHDYLGRSVGYGGLSIWAHNLKDMKFITNYTGKTYHGPAVKVLAGVQVLEAYEFVNKHGHMIVGGECQSVGLAGGYTAGGGQSPLSSLLGLAADQTLEFEVVTAGGRFVRATPDNEDADLYWALSGGGPGYGVVWSVTYRAYRDVPVTGAVLSFDSPAAGNTTTTTTNTTSSSSAVANSTFWQAVDAYHALVPAITDLGGYTFTTVSAASLSVSPLFVPNATRADVLALLAPLHAQLARLGIPYTSNTTTYPTFLSGWKALIGQEGAGEGGHMGSRLIPRRALLETPEKMSAVVRAIAAQGGSVLEMSIGARSATARQGRVPVNAVNPAWRISDVFLLTTGIDEGSTGASVDERVTRVWGDMLRGLAPESGTYVNEADVYEVDWQRSFYGEKYARLAEVKRRWDPEGVFYATTGVGSEGWARGEDGRLCRA